MNTIDFDGDPSSGFNDLTINKISSNNINKMSDQSVAQAQLNASQTASYPSQTDSAPSIASKSIFSYFMKEHVVSEFKADIGEIVVVFLTTTGISYYMGDELMIACERGSIMGLGQFLGGLVGDASASIPSMANISSLLIKFIVSTSVYIGGNEYVLTNATPLEIKQMFGESLIASVAAHYLSQATKMQINNLSQNQYLSMYN